MAFYIPTLKDKLYSHMKKREGYRTDVYLDTLGKPTCGIGHLLTAEEKEQYPVGTVVDELIIKHWYLDDITKALVAAENQAKEMNVDGDDIIVALTSVNFQLGTNWTKKFPTAWMYLINGDYDEAIDEILFSNKEKKIHSRWYKQTPVRVYDFIDAIEQLKEKE